MSQQRNRARQGEKQQPWLFEMNFIRQMRWLELPCPFPTCHFPSALPIVNFPTCPTWPRINKHLKSVYRVLRFQNQIKRCCSIPQQPHLPLPSTYRPKKKSPQPLLSPQREQLSLSSALALSFSASACVCVCVCGESACLAWVGESSFLLKF